MVSSKVGLMFLVILVLFFSSGCDSTEPVGYPWDVDTWDYRTSITEETDKAALNPEGENSLSL